VSPVLGVVLVYLAIVLAIGFLSHRLFRGTGEDYFLASRSIGSIVLLLTLFGTHMTAFTILGASSEAHAGGIGVFALMASSSSLVVPLVFYGVGLRLWWLGKREGFVTQVQFFRERYESDVVGLALFVVLVALLVPYVLIGVKGGGDVLWALTGGPAGGIEPWIGSLLMCAIIFLYVVYGGMRSTAWANTFQTLVFMSVGVLAFHVILSDYGGLSGAMRSLEESRPELLAIGKDSHQLGRMVSYLLIPLSAGVFPHIFAHWLSAKSARSFRAAIVLYPVCITLVWIPSVVLGVVGNIEFPPPLQGPVLIHLILNHAGGLLAGLLAAGVFAAIMSSLDSQTLAAGTLFSRDVVRHFGFHDRMSERGQVLSGRFFVALFLAAALLASQWTSRTIFELGVWSLSGFAGLFPVVVGALYWRRSTKSGVLAAIGTVVVLWIGFYVASFGTVGEYSVGGSGVLPVVFLLAGACFSLVTVSLATAPPRAEVVERFFPDKNLGRS
jgi:SSS family solute:Na+ symporter